MIEYRHLTEISEHQHLLKIQEEVWGFAEIEMIPARLFLVAVKVGGQVIGAYDGDSLVGFCFSIPGIKRDAREIYLHSHMLGVLPEYRNRGIGRALKLEQRADALSRGIRLIEWTFDPLELKNAFLNIERLGVIVRRYILNNYGVTTSKLHGGLPTDRCVAEWRLDDPRTMAILERQPRQKEVVWKRIEIPNTIARIRSDQPAQARRIQQDVGEKFQQYFRDGLVVTGFERSDEHGAYLLS